MYTCIRCVCIMYHTDYRNFVRPNYDEDRKCKITLPRITGEEAKKLYLEEVKNSDHPKQLICDQIEKDAKLNSSRNRKRYKEVDVTDKELFQLVQSNDTEKVCSVLDTVPDKINIVDDFGWNLLMIACQANSVETVKELLNRGIDTSVRDKAGNSAQSLIIKNKNYVLADIILSHKSHENTQRTPESFHRSKHKEKESYLCEICSNTLFPDKQEHLSSTVHNINASKDKKIPTNYVIPETNKGFQLMLKGGWNKETGLGPDGSGAKYPIKPILKKDKNGLGLKKKTDEPIKESLKIHNRRMLEKERHNDRMKEINFRREFY